PGGQPGSAADRVEVTFRRPSMGFPVKTVSGSGQALPGRLSYGDPLPGRFAVIAALLSGRFAAELPVPGCYHGEKAT
ncbi:MAG: hypothetical protein Q8K88_09390, partial [Bradyrhizobium sp.]|nr:hypothetical protein [Bradyrhizobium sp.]